MNGTVFTRAPRDVNPRLFHFRFMRLPPNRFASLKVSFSRGPMPSSQAVAFMAPLLGNPRRDNQAPSRSRRTGEENWFVVLSRRPHQLPSAIRRLCQGRVSGRICLEGLNTGSAGDFQREKDPGRRWMSPLKPKGPNEEPGAQNGEFGCPRRSSGLNRRSTFLVNLATLHHELDALKLCDIVQRIATHRHDIGIAASLD
jgi:hypothetical protein